MRNDTWKSSRQVRWNALNRKHIVDDHRERGLTVDEINSALADPLALDLPDRRHGTTTSIGAAESGRLLFIAWIQIDRRTIYPVHARPVGRKDRQDYEKARKARI